MENTLKNVVWVERYYWLQITDIKSNRLILRCRIIKWDSAFHCRISKCHYLQDFSVGSVSWILAAGILGAKWVKRWIMNISSLNIYWLLLNPSIFSKVPQFCPYTLPSDLESKSFKNMKMFISFNSEINPKEMIKNEDHNVHHSMLPQQIY